MPISAGILMVRARIAVWEFTDPCTVTKDNTRSLFNCTVSEGARSSATMITGSSDAAMPAVLPPSTLNTRSEMSLTSADLALM